MHQVRRSYYTRAIPADAQILKKSSRGQVLQVARFRHKGKLIDAPLTADGQKCRIQTDRWQIRYKNAAGKWQTHAGYTDKAATETLARRLVEQVHRELRGETDRFDEHRGRPIDEHLEAFFNNMLHRRKTRQHAEQTRNRARRVLDGCRVETIDDLDAGEVETFLADLQKLKPLAVDLTPRPATPKACTYRDIAAHFGVTVHTVNAWRRQGAPIRPKRPNDLEAIRRWRSQQEADRGPVSVNTRNAHLRAIKQFSAWLKRDRRAKDDPLKHLSFTDAAVDRRHDRRALSDDEFRRLIESAAAGPVVEGVPGPERAMIYVLAAWTGFRRAELASLTRRSIDLDGDPPTVTVLAGYAKNHRRDQIPLHAFVVARLRAWLATDGPTDQASPLFALRTPGGRLRKTSKMMRLDLERAGLPYVDEDGLFADFHSNRHTFITNLGRQGVPLTTAQQLARHGDPKLTANIYTHLELADKAAAIDRLTPPIQQDGQQEAAAILRATGTDDRPDAKALPQPYHGSCRTGQNGARPDTTGKAADEPDGSPQTVSMQELDATSQDESGPDDAVKIVRLEGLEPSAYGLKVTCHNPENTGKTAHQPIPCHSLTMADDPDIAELVARWPTLPPEIRSALRAVLAAAPRVLRMVCPRNRADGPATKPE